jgi:serine/threonine protein kinase
MYSPLLRRNSYPPDNHGIKSSSKKQIPIKSTSWNSTLTVIKKYTENDFWINSKQFTKEGAYSEIYKGIERTTLKKVIIKYIEKENIREIKQLELIPVHNNIVRYFGYITLTKGLIFEFMPDGNLQEYLKNNNIYEQHIKMFTYQIANGLYQLHSNLIIHRDIKTPNILIDIKNQTLTLKICDFGSSRKSDETFIKKFDSTYYYASPEILKTSSINTPAIDIFALGVIMSEIINKVYSNTYYMPYCYNVTFPIPSYKHFTIMTRILEGKLPNIHDNCPNDIKDIMYKCLKYDYTERISADKLMQSLAFA